MAANTSNINTQLPPFQTVAEVLASLQAALQNAANGQPGGSVLTNLNAGGATETLLEAVSLALGVDADQYPNTSVSGAYRKLQDVWNSAFILTATGQALDLKAADVGVTRKPPAFATSSGYFVPAPGVAPPSVNTTIPAGTVVGTTPADPSQPATAYVTASTITYLANQPQSPQVAIQAVQAGSAGNQTIAGVIDQVLSGPSGLAFSNTIAATGGFDTEGDDAPNGGLRARALAAIPAGSTTKAAIELNARNYVGVVSAYCKTCTDNDGTSFLLGRNQLYVDDGTGNMATNNVALLAQMQADFDSGLYHAAGIQTMVRGSVSVPVFVALSIFHSAAFVASGQGTQATIDAAVATAVFNYVNSTPIGRGVTLAGILETAMSVPGVANVLLSSILVNGNPADLTPNINQVLRCGSVASVTVADLGTNAFFG